VSDRCDCSDDEEEIIPFVSEAKLKLRCCHENGCHENGCHENGCHENGLLIMKIKGAVGGDHDLS